jgi:GTPase involved in cell partitioning and DNA repair
MSEFAYFRFMSNNMLTVEEQQHKDEIIALTEQVLDAKGIECDSKISKISEEQLREILEGVRRLRKRNKKRKRRIEEEEEEEEKDNVEDNRQKEEVDIAPMQ